jgi:hypothetical protein
MVMNFEEKVLFKNGLNALCARVGGLIRCQEHLAERGAFNDLPMISTSDVNGIGSKEEIICHYFPFSLVLDYPCRIGFEMTRWKKTCFGSSQYVRTINFQDSKSFPKSTHYENGTQKTNVMEIFIFRFPFSWQ